MYSMEFINHNRRNLLHKQVTTTTLEKWKQKQNQHEAPVSDEHELENT